MKTVAEMLEEVKKYYNLNDTLLAVELGIKSTGNITQWRKGETKPSKNNYIKLKTMYDKVMSLKDETKEEAQEELFYGCRKPYEVGIPKVGTAFYFMHYNGRIEKIVFEKNIDHELFMNAYLSGNLHNTEEEAKQKLREDKLMFKIKKWVEENQGDWTPNWNDDDETIHEVQIDRFPMYACDSPLVINEVEEVHSVSVFPYFYSYETARKFIDEFRGEIEEVFFKC